MKWDEYKGHINKAMDAFEFDDKIPLILKNSIKNNQKIFVAGNGGSAAIASHYVCDLSKGATYDWSKNFKRYQAICLSNNLSYMTAISNDEHYDEVFKQQLINLASPNDILILISSSGNSPNIIKALKWAKENGMITIGVSGFKGGKLKEMADYSAHINHPDYEVCEDIHHIFGHFLAVYLREAELKETEIKEKE
ncbi:MAG: SIS domain-containing protein [Nanoarchaeota archaeon]|nr:SIS domain-containing protein [Nanoarchaeota archaeon]MBU1320867.1 SIS domain-containing protein [Nanoarchaeota archaeon]MBU1597773.1 SIS domain-containing protein [Nanoarchaeota archaeon]MBU2441224.1 SIS domain-containing protein [Nanoarchaeota archaeon]